MEKTNNYPVVLVHGFLCWGDGSNINKFLPCFGLWNGNAKLSVYDAGLKCYTPHVGPFNSMWDRACILYAKLKGGRVDFGKVRSEKYGYQRYGETYEAMIPDWGELDTEGKIKKINLVGHSFGGPTVRTLIHLLTEGSEEERAGTPEDELSDLFKGGKGNWVHSCTTLVATHNGVTLPDAARPLVDPLQYVIYTLGNLVSGTFISRLYNFDLDRFGITSTKKHLPINMSAIKHLISLKEGNIFYELDTTGGTVCTKDYKPYDNIYYFSYPARRTKTHFGMLELPTKDIWLPLRLFSIFECLYKSEDYGREWQPNDGIVNVATSKAPIYEKQTDFVSNEACKPGVWHVMPLEWKDHTSYMGVGETAEDYDKFFKDIVERVTTLPVID